MDEVGVQILGQRRQTVWTPVGICKANIGHCIHGFSTLCKHSRLAVDLQMNWVHEVHGLAFRRGESNWGCV